MLRGRGQDGRAVFVAPLGDCLWKRPRQTAAIQDPKKVSFFFALLLLLPAQAAKASSWSTWLQLLNALCRIFGLILMEIHK